MTLQYYSSWAPFIKRFPRPLVFVRFFDNQFLFESMILLKRVCHLMTTRFLHQLLPFFFLQFPWTSIIRSINASQELNLITQTFARVIREEKGVNPRQLKRQRGRKRKGKVEMNQKILESTKEGLKGFWKRKGIRSREEGREWERKWDISLLGWCHFERGINL